MQDKALRLSECLCDPNRAYAPHIRRLDMTEQMYSDTSKLLQILRYLASGIEDPPLLRGKNLLAHPH